MSFSSSLGLQKIEYTRARLAARRFPFVQTTVPCFSGRRTPPVSKRLSLRQCRFQSNALHKCSQQAIVPHPNRCSICSISHRRLRRATIVHPIYLSSVTQLVPKRSLLVKLPSALLIQTPPLAMELLLLDALPLLLLPLSPTQLPRREPLFPRTVLFFLSRVRYHAVVHSQAFLPARPRRADGAVEGARSEF